MRIPYSLHIDRLVNMAIEEDVGHGDITTEHLGLCGKQGRGEIVAKENLVLAGVEMVGRVFEKIDPAVAVHCEYADGDAVDAGTPVISVAGDMAALLLGERTALNFLQRMSGVATHVRRYADLLTQTSVRLVDTRKTVPGWRVLEKHAVRAGGAHNHRMGLYDGVLIKDNHIIAAGSIANAVDRIRENVSHLVRIEVEVTNFGEVEEALAAGVDIIMLDNFADSEIPAAVARVKGRALVEVSGGVNRERIEYLVSTGVDIISAGALVHAARFVDLSMAISGGK